MFLKNIYQYLIFSIIFQVVNQMLLCSLVKVNSFFFYYFIQLFYLEFLPSLMPRFYSICRYTLFDLRRKKNEYLIQFSSPLDDARSITFVYSVLKFEVLNGRTYDRFGVCTNWLNKIDIGTKVIYLYSVFRYFID